MRFDLVDLQLFIAVAETRSITNGAATRSSGAGLGQRADQGTGSGARRIAAHARPARRRTDAGRRKPARSCQDRDPQCRGDARRSRRLMPAARRRPSASSPTRRAFRNICRRRWPPSCASTRTSRSTSRSAKAPTSPAPSLTGAADLGLAAEHALPDNIERIPFSEDRLVLVAAARGRTGEPAAGRFQRSGGARFRRPDHLDRAACPCQRTRGAARRAPALSRAAEQFRCDRPDGRRRHRRRRDARSRRKTMRAIDEDQRRQDQGPLGQPAARDLRPQLQGVAEAGAATGRASAQVAPR